MSSQAVAEESDHPSWTGILESPPSAEVQIDGRRYCYFAGTAYFALQGHPAVIRAGCDAFQKYGVHSATSRGGYGCSPPILEVERLAAELFDAEAAFYFITGYWGANFTLAALQPHFDIVFYDEHSHYSILEAVQLAGRKAFAFAHRSADDLQAKLRSELRPGERPLVVSDGVFASSGRIAPVGDYQRMLREYPGACVVIDDAHGVGILGAGRGTFAHFGIASSTVNQEPRTIPGTEPQLYFCGTLSKALGGSGGIIAGSAAWIDRVKSAGSYFSAASGPASPVAAATAAALQLVLAEPDIRKRTSENANRLRTGLRALGLPCDDSPVPFLNLVLRDAAFMQHVQSTLRERGLIIGYFKTYSGVGAEGSLRIAVSAGHTAEMIDRLLREFAALLGT